jgi:hypothetical protein
MTPEKKKAVAEYNKTVARMRKAVATKRPKTKKKHTWTPPCSGQGQTQNLPKGSSI